MNLSKAVAFVTGAGQGLGKATALRLAKKGAKVSENYYIL
jgi:NAD(P)-dependent dehydrogenase (short-subunit alcohol dehydrogenase family)